MLVFAIFGVLCLLASALLILIVVVQNSKGGGLSSTFGASNISSMIGARKATQDIEKYTWYLAAALAIFSFVANISMGSGVKVQNQDQGRGLIKQIESGDFTVPANPSVSKLPQQPKPQPSPQAQPPSDN